MKLKQGQKLLFIGDSITDCDRAKPDGEGLFDATGRGYVTIVNALLTSVYPELGIRIVNKGISGNTVRDLKARWETDVIEEKPDWVAIMIGINDVWRQFDLPFMPERHVRLDEYEATLRELVRRTKPLVEGIVLMTPFYIEPNGADAMRAMMDRYGAAVKRIAAEEGTLFVDTQAAFNRVLETLYPAALAWDRVHPTQAGHMILARAFLNAVGFDWSRMERLP
ncbi:MAG: GDSL family lipase [Thermobacillus sp. ZCTH02-B1]|uniref:SGNH/GDSL hydrolase family protein n=1 Tax=Thermobacillus sp. ZCTH02-B1 TaxID=1858795 RepID=UPI000B555AA1|nr:SGNH/GDSL hydrolase family protein [Thermobacillus sp. ZCTH02-B1]OUM95182.1 MAG: GDSL family lipase [Thermobacillus sp. ZCTH02-B1]